MGFALVIIGLLMVITGGRGTYAQFGSQLASEFQGKNSFTYQMIGLGTVGALGYIPALQTFSRWALALILLVILIGNKNSSGFFTAFQSALASGPKVPATPAGSPSLAPGQTMQGGGSFASVLSGQTSLFNFLQGSQTTITPAQ